MKTFRIALLTALMFLAAPLVMHAQGGCVDSPEAPIEVLVMIGSAGMIFGSSLAMKIVRNNRKS